MSNTMGLISRMVFILSAVISIGAANAADNPHEGTTTMGEKAWLSHGFTEAQRGSIRAACQWGIENKFVPGGSLLIVHRGETVFREGFGVADLKTGRPFVADAPCRIASITKPHISTLMAMLAERGKLSLDDPIDKYLPCFTGVAVRGKGPASRVPTIRELLSHTAGFPGKKPDRSEQLRMLSQGTLAGMAEALARQGLAAEPGTAFVYATEGYRVAARIAEVATSKEFASLMDENLLKPIGSTTATFRPSKELLAKMPAAYDRKPDGLVPLDSAERLEALISPLSAPTSLFSTVDDVGRFLLLHRNRGVVDGKRLVAAESLQPLYKPWRPKGAGYGLGFNILKTDPNGVGVHIRHIGGAGTLADLDFENDVIIVLFTQVSGAKIAPFREHVLKAIQSVFAPNQQPAPESPDREGQ